MPASHSGSSTERSRTRWSCATILSRKAIECVDGYPIPPLNFCIRRYIEAAQLTNAAVCCLGVSVNASHLTEADYRQARAEIEAETGLPCVDPIREGVERLVATLLVGRAP